MIRINGNEFKGELIQSRKINRAVMQMCPELDVSPTEFRRLWIIVSKILFQETFKDLNGRSGKTIVAPVLRAAAPLINLDLIGGAAISYNWTKRDEGTKIASRLCCNIPDEIPKDWELIFFDPIIATGTSLEQVIELALTPSYCKWHGKPAINVLCGIAAPEGLKRLSCLYPEVQFKVGFTGNNLSLDKNKYVIHTKGPLAGKQVAGDIGDRLTRISGERKLIL